MGDIISFTKDKKPSPLPELHVCGTCDFYRRSVFVGTCHAIGGEYTIIAWRRCQGTYWMKKKGIWSKIKAFFS